MKGKIRKLQRMYFFFDAVLVVFAGFTVPYLKKLGLSNSQVGFYMSIMMLNGILGQFTTGYICDLKKTIKKVFLILTLMLSIAVSLIYRIEVVEIKLIILPIIGFIQSSMMSLIDSWVLESHDEVKKSYGLVRAFGSLGWGLSAIIIGRCIDQFGWESLITIHLILSAIFIWMIIRVDDVKKAVNTDENKVSLKHVKIMLSNGRYVTVVTIFLLLFMAMQAYSMFVPILIEKYGGDKGDIGLFFMIAAFSEIPMFLYSKRLLERLKASQLLIICCFIFIIKMLITAFTRHVSMLVFIGLFQMFTYTLATFTAKRLIDDVSPENLKTSAQTIAMGIYLGVSGFVTYNLSGNLADHLGIQNTLIIQGGLCLAALLMSIYYNRRFYVEKSVDNKRAI
ncbi:MFS transporter [Wukongibacter baidiensis]|uniref:MFS transporter n=1 Tax=Wukongibacter baidiensis TaxID=1723361 RepID=UPI003D7FEFFB